MSHIFGPLDMGDYRPVDTGDLELNRAVNLVLAASDEAEPVWWWLSFCDPARPEGNQYLRGCVVAAPNIVMAAAEAYERECNPGGEVMGWPIREEYLPDEEWRNRLLTREESTQAGVT